MADITEVVEKLKKDIKTSIDNLNSIRKGEKWSIGLILTCLPEIGSVIRDTIVGIETISQEAKALTSKEKRDAVVNVINSCVDIPYLPEAAEKFIFGLAIDAILKVYNRKFGKGTGEEPEADWIEEPMFMSVHSIR